MEGYSAGTDSSGSDALAWLNKSRSARALDWVTVENRRTLARLTSDPRYSRYYEAALAVIQDETSFPGSDQSPAALSGGWVYNVSRSESHPLGVWRRTSLASFRKPLPEWETLLDLDQLARAEGVTWGIGSPKFSPSNRRCMLALINSGWGKVAWREFDLEQKRFVEHGFDLPEVAYSSVAWKDENTLIVATDFGKASLGDLGPRTVKEWSRGEPLDHAKQIFADESALLVDIRSLLDENGEQLLLLTSYHQRQVTTNWIGHAGGRFQRMTLPGNAMIGGGVRSGVYRGEVIVRINEDWSIGGRSWKAGSLLSMPIANTGDAAPVATLMAAPSSAREVITSVQVASDGVLVFAMENARSRLWRFVRTEKGWQRDAVPLGSDGQIGIASEMDDPTSKSSFVTYQDFAHAPSLYEIEVANNRATQIKAARQLFEERNYLTEQLEAKSADGTLIPYFVVRPRSLKYTADAPTLLYGYGSYGGPQYAQYDAVLGRLWLKQGGVYVVANVRGGGEFGEAWHVTGVQRQHTYDDFLAIAQDLIHRKITSPRRLGVYGYSAGGLLGGVAITQRPDLFNAAFLLAPVLDQLRLDLLGTSPSSQTTEYGSPDVPEERAFLERTSPLQQLNANTKLPTPFIYSNTSDENVYPAQSRRFVARMQALGIPYLYYEASEGGHNFGATPEELARGNALAYVYLAQRLMDSSSGGEGAGTAVEKTDR